MTNKTLEKSIEYLSKKSKVLFLTTSNRWVGDKELPKSTSIAHHIASKLKNIEIIDVTKLKIHECEGNVSTKRGNSCGEMKALLKDDEKNPSGFHRCWASLNNKDDELWKISRALFNSECIVFFVSVRWGQTNSMYQKLIERLTWIENRHSTLGEKNVISNIDAGIIVIGQNWHGADVLATEKKVLDYFGFKVKDEICWNWQFTTADDESRESYANAAKAFEKEMFDK